jgi:hypothetical protein
VDVGVAELELARQLQQVSAGLGFASTKHFSREFHAVREPGPTDFQRRQNAEVNRRLD